MSKLLYFGRIKKVVRRDPNNDKERLKQWGPKRRRSEGGTEETVLQDQPEVRLT